MTQRERILSMLRAAGSEGVRSDEFIKSYMPRAAARVQELKDSGYEISSEREGKFCRYVLTEGVGVSAGAFLSPGNAGLAGNDRRTSADSDAPEGQLFQLPSMNPLTNREAA